MESKKRILVVDDEQHITMVMRSGLTKHGYEVRVAAEGESALELFPTGGKLVLKGADQESLEELAQQRGKNE